jgi:hypothetical protein
MGIPKVRRVPKLFPRDTVAPPHFLQDQLVMMGRLWDGIVQHSNLTVGTS